MTFLDSLTLGSLEVRLANSPEEILAVQKIRYQVFYEELSSSPLSIEITQQKRDFDALDNVCQHLIVIDHDVQEVVGGYRLISETAAATAGGFLTSTEFDISPLKGKGPILELGRACIAVPYRKRGVIALLWQWLASYTQFYNIEFLFGCASFPGIDYQPFTQALSFLYHFYLAPPFCRPHALAHSFVEMNIIPKKDINVTLAFQQLPPLIKGYIRLGGFVGDGVFIDRPFHSLDVCIIVETKNLSDKYTNHYARSSN